MGRWHPRPDWTYIYDIVRGTILAADKLDDGTTVNLGTTERITLMDAVSMVFEYTGHNTRVELHPEMPTGPLNRVAGNSLAKKLPGWEPEVNFREGLRRTKDWYSATRHPDQVKAMLSDMLTKR